MTDDIKNELLKLSMFSNIPKKYRILCAGGFSLIDNLQNENKELKNQQKEFIDYLTAMISAWQREKQEYDTLTNRAMIVAYEMVYSKYKEIIEDDNNG